jgi:hypothetical protein
MGVGRMANNPFILRTNMLQNVTQAGSLEQPKQRNIDWNTMHPKESGCEGTDWMHLVECRVQWRALVNTVMNLRVRYKSGNIWLTGRLLAPEDGMDSVKSLRNRVWRCEVESTGPVRSSVFHKRTGTSWLHERTSASQKGLCSVGCVKKLVPNQSMFLVQYSIRSRLWFPNQWFVIMTT